MPKLKTVLKPNLKLERVRREYRKQQGVYRTTYLALVNGRIRGTRPGYLWVHDLASADSSDNNTYGPPYQLRMKAGAAIQYRPNWKVKVASEDGIELITGMDEVELERIGYDTLQTNPLDPSLQFKLIEHLQNLQSFPNGDATVRVMPSIYKKLDGTFAIFGQMDVDVLTGNVPSAGNQVVACIFLRDDNTPQVTVSSEESRDIDLKQDTATALALINECVAAADIGALGIWSYIIWDDTTALTLNNKFHDLRGILGVGSSGDGTLTVVKHPFFTETILYEDTLASSGSWDVSSISQDYDTLVIELLVQSAVNANEDLVFLTFNNDTTNTNYRSGTGSGGSSSTSVNSENRRIGICSADISPADSFSTIHIRIPGYTGSKDKIAYGTSGVRVTTASIYVQESALHWESTAAINRITITTDNDPTDLFIAGSFIRIIGVKETEIVTSVTGVGGVDIDAIHDNVAAEISAITQKAIPVTADVLLIEDSEDSFNKKYIEIGDLPGGSGTDADAIHDNVAGEINAITPKATPVGADVLLIEDSEDSFNKKQITIDDLPSGTSLPVADTTAIVMGSGDNTKQLRFEVDGFTPSTTRVATPPDEDFTMVGVATSQTLANKILSQLHLLIGGFKAIFTHAFTADRTVTLPGDANVTLVGTDTTQNISNKTFTDQVLIDGTANEIQLRVQGNGTQTSSLVSIEDSAGNVQMSVSNNGAVVINEEGNANSTVIRIESNSNANAFVIEAGGIGSIDGAIGIGGTPDPDMLLDLISTEGAFGVPEMTALQYGSITPRDGSIVYASDLDRFLGWTNADWKLFGYEGADGIPFQDPSTLTWTALNQGSGTYAVDTANRRVTAQAAGSGAAQLRGWYTTVTPPYDFRFYIKFWNSDVLGNGPAIGFRQNSTGELHTFNQFHEATTLTPQYNLRKWNSAISTNSDYTAAKDVTMHANWVRIFDNNTSARGIMISEDGTNWQSLQSVSRTDFLDADEIFIGLFLLTVSADDAQATLLSMEDIS